MTPKEAREKLKEAIKNFDIEPYVEIAKKYRVLEQTRVIEVAYPRHYFCWFLSSIIGLKDETIGEIIGKERSTVYHSRNVHYDLSHFDVERYEELTGGIKKDLEKLKKSYYE